MNKDFLVRLWKSPVYIPSVVVLFAILPILSILAASALAQLFGCGGFTEGGGPPCVRFGMNFESLIYILGVCGWFMFITIPVGIGIILLWGGTRFVLYLFGKKVLNHEEITGGKGR